MAEWWKLIVNVSYIYIYMDYSCDSSTATCLAQWMLIIGHGPLFDMDNALKYLVNRMVSSLSAGLPTHIWLNMDDFWALATTLWQCNIAMENHHFQL